MVIRIADKIAVAAVLALIAGLVLAGCNDGRSGQGSNLNNSASTFAGQQRASDNGSEQAGADFGQDWDAAARERERSGRRSIRSLNQPGRASAGDTSGAPGGSEPFWTIVLGTFSGDNHQQAARTMLSELARISPELTNARTHTTSRGSMVIYGRYPSADNRQAAQDLERIKEMRYGDAPVFARAFLSRVTPRTASSDSSSYALMRVRERFPSVDPLYTLQVAAWGDFDSGTMTMDRIRREAEAYVQQLRAQGHQAFVHHDSAMKLSIVTVGLFDRTAFDAETGDRSPELRMLKRQFPAHLVNGEELQEPVDPRRPDRGTRVQQPHLVLVPMP